MLLLLLLQRIRKLAFGQPHSASARTYTSGKVVERYALHRGKFYATVASRPQCHCELPNVGLRIRVEPLRVRQDLHLKKGTSSVKTLNVGLRIRVEPVLVRQDVHLRMGTSSVKTLNVGFYIRVKPIRVRQDLHFGIEASSAKTETS